jgi:hypothetical protein
VGNTAAKGGRLGWGGAWDIIETRMENPATYLYCVVKSPRRPSTARAPRGLAEATAPEAVELGGSLWLIVAEVPLGVYGAEPLQQALGNMQWVSDAAVAHDEVVEYFARRPGSTTVPMKMFTMFSTRERAVVDMRARRQDIEPIVKRIAGADEWGVRIMRSIAAPPQAAPAVATASSGAAFLAAKKQVRDNRRDAALASAEAAEEAYVALAAVARDATRRDDVPKGASAPPLLDAAFLVPAERRARFKALARRVAARCEESGASMSLTGPWPAYNFVHLEGGGA